MAEAWGALLNFLGSILNGIYKVVPSYGLAIILLTLITRAVIAPLGVKQIRSMQKMQKLQPKIKELQKKYKGDRTKLNEEMMKLYKEHGANPLGGCFPMIAQFPVFIALYAVIRAVVPFSALPAAPVADTIPKSAICRPYVGPAALPTTTTTTTVTATQGSVRCELPSGEQTYAIGEWRDSHPPYAKMDPPNFLSKCLPATLKPDDKSGFACTSPMGTGHLPKDGKLFRDLLSDRATFLGMHLSCSPNQAASKDGIKQCTSGKTKPAGGASRIVYYSLILLMAGSTYIQQKQMSANAPTAQQAQQMKMMGIMMPVLFGVLSLNFPAALSVYWITGNVWTILQQKFIMGRQTSTVEAGPANGGKPDNPKGSDPKNGGTKGSKNGNEGRNGSKPRELGRPGGPKSKKNKKGR